MTHTCPPEHAHGATNNCYTSHRCRCQNCKDGCARRAAERRKLIAYGRWEGRVMVDARPALLHIRFLQAHGHPYDYIAERAGVNPRTIWKINTERARKVTRWVSDAILGVKPDFDALHDRAIIPSRGVRRRLQALAVLGWSQREIARRLGVHEDTVSKYVMVGDGVFVRTHRRVAAIYEELWAAQPATETPGQKQAASAARNRARRNGWAGPLSWDDIDTDPEPATTEPDTEPVIDEVAISRALTGAPQKLTPAELREAVRIAHSHRWSNALMADRLGVNPKTPERIRKELGLPQWEQHEIRSTAA